MCFSLHVQQDDISVCLKKSISSKLYFYKKKKKSKNLSNLRLRLKIVGINSLVHDLDINDSASC